MPGTSQLPPRAMKGLMPTLCCTGAAGDRAAQPIAHARGGLLSYLCLGCSIFAAFPIPLPSLSAQVTGVDVGWTLGYMLNLTNMIPSEIPQRVVGLQRSNWIAATVLLATMLILTFCLLALMCCQKSSSGYVSL